MAKARQHTLYGRRPCQVEYVSHVSQSLCSFFQITNSSIGLHTADLGCGRVLKKGDMAVSQAGHIVTRPPEMGRMYYDHRSDIWSVGKVALLLARLAKLPEVIQIQHAEDVEYGDWHPFLRNFVQRCLQPQHSRDNAASMLQVLPPL